MVNSAGICAKPIASIRIIKKEVVPKVFCARHVRSRPEREELCRDRIESMGGNNIIRKRRTDEAIPNSRGRFRIVNLVLGA